MDAIIVPTARPPRAMEHAIRLATELECTLVALCSKDSSADGVAQLALSADVELLAIDAGELPTDLLPRFETCDLLDGTKFHRPTDTSRKRNLGLQIARMAGWDRIVFLDDDIVIPDPLDLRRAAALAHRFAGVGLNIEGYPDNSVVCHAYREAGGAQEMFVGGGALMVHTAATPSFFPNIYNEDWFFLLNGEQLPPTAVTGVAVQKPYDPFARADRARMEELGDVLAEGLFWLLDEGRSLREADTAHWRRYLARRQSFITETIAMVENGDMDSARRVRMLSSLAAAYKHSRSIEPELCEEYVRVWRADQKTWRDHLDHQPRTGAVDKVLVELGLAVHSRYRPRQQMVTPAGL